LVHLKSNNHLEEGKEEEEEKEKGHVRFNQSE